MAKVRITFRAEQEVVEWLDGQVGEAQPMNPDEDRSKVLRRIINWYRSKVGPKKDERSTRT
jgi:hypothetical protein